MSSIIKILGISTPLSLFHVFFEQNANGPDQSYNELNNPSREFLKAISQTLKPKRRLAEQILRSQWAVTQIQMLKLL